MNSYIKIDRESYREETAIERIEMLIASVICACLSFLDGVLEVLSRPLVSLFIKASAVIVTVVICIGAAGGIENETLTFASAAIRILASSAVSFLIVKGI